MLAWLLYVMMVTLLLSAAYMAERTARLRRASSRWVWIAAFLASLLLPTTAAGAKRLRWRKRRCRTMWALIS